MPRTRYHEQLVQFAITAGLMPPDNFSNSRSKVLQLRAHQVAKQEEYQLRRTSTAPPPWIRTRKSSFLIPEPEGSFTPADLVFPLPPPLDSPRPAEETGPADAKWKGGATIDLSKFQHFNNHGRFDRHLRRLHELVETSEVITAGEQYRDPTRSRHMGQMYISNLFGLYEVEHWSNESGRKAQVEWTLWILDVLHADRRGKKLRNCPVGARKVLKIAIADVLGETELKKKRRCQRMLEGTRLETGILQAVGLRTVARTCCVRTVTRDGENAVFAERKREEFPAVNGDDILARLGSFLMRRRIGQAFDDASIIATAMRRRITTWERLRRHSGLEFPSFELVLRRLSGMQYAPTQPSRLRQLTLPPSSASSTGGKKTAKPRKAKPYRTLAVLWTFFGTDVKEGARRARNLGPENLIVELQKMRAERADAGAGAREMQPVADSAQTQRGSTPATSMDQMVHNEPQGTKRPLSDISTTPGSAQEETKRRRFERRKSSLLLSYSPSEGSAEEAIVVEQAENVRRRSSSLFGSSPSTGEQQNLEPSSQLENVGPVPAHRAIQVVSPPQPEVQDRADRMMVTQTQHQALQQPQGLVAVGTQLRPPGRQYRSQAKYKQHLLGQRPPSAQQPHPPLWQSVSPQSPLQHPAPAPSSLPLQHLLQGPPRGQPHSPHLQGSRQPMVPQMMIGAREDFWRRIPIVPDAAQMLQEQIAAHGQAAWAEIHRHYQLIHQLLAFLPAFQNATAQQIAEATRARIGAQFGMAEARFKNIFPTLALPPSRPQDQPLDCQIFALTWILRTVNPPRGGWGDFEPDRIACCQLEARVAQLDLLRTWTRQWEETLAGARTDFSKQAARFEGTC